MSSATCRFCRTPLHRTFVDLGMSPLCESFVPAHRENEMEPFYPLHVWICEKCLLVQLQEYVAPENIFTDYAYFSSYSDSWLQHAKRYTDLMVERFGFNTSSQVVEIASNDGYLLQYFLGKGIPVLGVEPAENVAAKAMEKGIPSEVRFFGVETANYLVEKRKQADLLLGNNVLAHVPDINDFVGGMKLLLKPAGVITMEFPHLARLMAGNQYDTIYHEHFSYLSFTVVQKIFAAHGLTLFDVEELKSHGGSLRIYACHAESSPHLPAGPRVAELLQREKDEGFQSIDHHLTFAPKVIETKHQLLEFLIQEKRAGRRIAGYGAPGKGNTLLNFCGIRTDFLDYTVDRNPFKHGRFCPGTHIPIFPVEKIAETKPDLLLILPWNLKDEIIKQMGYIREWGGRFVVPIPEVTVYT